MDDLNVESAIVPVTGAASGIGLAICKRLRKAGALPLLLDVDASKLQAAVHEVYGPTRMETAQYGYLVDVGNSEAVDACLAQIAKDHGLITHAVANAGRALAAHILEMSDAQWHGLMDVNLHGVLYFTRAAARHLTQRKGGALVLMASIAGLMAKESRVGYASSKAAIINMTRALALDLGTYGIRVNAVAPGIIATPLQTNPSFQQCAAERTALKRIGTADEIANATLFLLSNLSSYVTGHTLVADGGLTANYA